jgi:hypothetical protein
LALGWQAQVLMPVGGAGRGSRKLKNEGISHFTRLYLKKLKELKRLTRYRHVALAGSRVFIRAVQQVNGWENKAHMFAGSAVIPAS